MEIHYSNARNNFRVVKAWESFSNATFTNFEVNWERNDKNGKHTGMESFLIQKVKIGAIYDENMEEIKET